MPLAFRNRLLKLSIWKLTQPLFSLQHLYEFDLARAKDLSSSAKQLPPGITVQLFRGEGDIDSAAEKLQRAGVPTALVQERMKRGDMVALALSDGQLAAYTWVTFADAWIAEAGRTLPLRGDEAVQFDTLVLPQWRGRGLQYALTVPVLEHLSEQGYRRTLAWVDARNKRSIKNQLRQGKRRIATVAGSPLLGVARLQNVSAAAGIALEKRRRSQLKKRSAQPEGSTGPTV